MSHEDLTDLGLLGVAIASIVGFIICWRGIHEAH